VTTSISADALRRAVLSSLPEQASQFDEEPPAEMYLYVPRSHERALSFDTVLVQGIRGAGKSLWWAALQRESHRRRISKTLGEGIVTGYTRVVSGFGASPGQYPHKLTLQKLVKQYDAADVWRAVVHHAVVGAGLVNGLTSAAPGPFGDSASNWPTRIEWVVGHPESFEEFLAACNKVLAESQQRFLIVFDALDRTSSDWQSRRLILRGLLIVLLDLRSFRSIRGKAFVRPDMIASPDVLSFPDASKITSNDVHLQWSRADLFGLLWQHLANAPEGGDVFRRLCNAEQLRLSKEGGIWRVSQEEPSAEERQRRLFHQLSGPYMGQHARRGYPYTWLPNHLADTHGQVSPRSFLAALRHAAEEASPSDRWALPYKGIQAGVQRASQIRVQEVGEDFPWVTTAAEPLRGLVLPCAYSEIAKRWRTSGVLEKLRRAEDQPQHLEDGPSGLRRDLEALGFFERMSDGRVNMPDVYRVGFGLGRKGGVRPVR